MKLDWVRRDPEQGRRDLAAWLNTRPGVSGAEVTSWKIPRAGSSYETIFCRTTWVQDGEPRDEDLVLRVQPGTYSLFPDADLFMQSAVLQAIASVSDLPVPAVYWTEPDPAVLGSPFFVMQKIDGQVPPDLISRRKGNFVEDLSFDERRTLYRNAVHAMADIHRIGRPDVFPFLEGRAPGEVGLDQYLGWVENWYRWGSNGRRFDLIETGLRNLRDRQPSDPGIGLIWGDARPGNMIFGTDLRPGAVIDWEMAALGPGEVDLGWWTMWETIWNAPGDRPELEGFMTRDMMIAAYEERLGRPVRDMAYYELLAGIRFAIMMMIGVEKRIEAGVLGEDTTAGSQNLATCFTAKLLGLPSPGLSSDLAKLASEMGDG